MTPTRPLSLLPLVLAVLIGCGGAPSAGTSAPGAMQLSITLPLAAPGDVSRVSVTVSGADMPSQSTDLVLTSGNWGGVLGDIPAGTGRTFLARAYTSTSTLRYEGRADNVTVTAGATGLLALILQDVDVLPPLNNEAPIIDSLVASATSVAPGGSVTVTATARDPNAGDTLSYAWSAPAGVFAAPTQASTSWTAPTAQGPVKLSLQVKDSRGATVAVSLTLLVTAGSGTQDVRVDFNTAPRVVSLSSSRAALDVGQATTLTATASDADGDALNYQWSATCAGTFTGASTASATFTPSSLPTAACNNCQFTVTVKDGRGRQNTGSLAMCVTKDAERKAPPRVTHSLQSSLTANASQQLTFEVGASDPEGLALTFAWGASAGTLGTASTDATRSRIGWTAPTCLPAGTPTKLTVTVSSTSGLKVTREFSVTGLPTCAVPTGWSMAGPMSSRRTGHQATLLSNGTVLVTGGHMGGGYTKTAELYDPATNTFNNTGSASAIHFGATATRLADGRVLVAGGYMGGSDFVTTVELYDPTTGTFSTTGPLAQGRYFHTATRLASGKVLVAGGYNHTGLMATAELYDPATGTWSGVASMSAARDWFAATLLPDGKVLVSGGVGTMGGPKPTELFDPTTNTWSLTGSAIGRDEHGMVLLPTGKVLSLGGSPTQVDSYDPSTGTWSSAGALTTERSELCALLLPNGKVLAAGGMNPYVLESAELYDPATGTSKAIGSMAKARRSYTMTLLPSGKVLVTGGFTHNNEALSSAELYTPEP